MILFFEKCAVRHDGNQYILTVKTEAKKEGGDGSDRVIGYFKNEKHLIQGIIKHGLGSDAVGSINEISVMVDGAVDMIEKLIINSGVKK